MGLEDIQKEVDAWASQFDPSYWPALEQYAQLNEEVGELGRLLLHKYGHKKLKENEKENPLGEELADVLFPIICIANREGIDLQAAWKKMLEERLYKRDNKRYTRK
jgi:NTP pyrophosphatase (non-canonical NTP hydrolase)